MSSRRLSADSSSLRKRKKTGRGTLVLTTLRGVSISKQCVKRKDRHRECSSSLDRGEREAEGILVDDLGSVVGDQGSERLILILDEDGKISKRNLYESAGQPHSTQNTRIHDAPTG